MKNNGLYIFTRDLRIQDNNGINKAVSMCDYVYTTFFFNKEQVDNNTFKSYNSIQFMIESLQDLEEEIKQKTNNKGQLICIENFSESLTKLIKLFDINIVFITKDVTPYSKKRNQTIQNIISSFDDVEFIEIDDFYLVTPGTIKTSSGTPYMKFTPYYNKVMDEVKIKQIEFQKPKTSNKISSNLIKPNKNIKIPNFITLKDAMKKYGSSKSNKYLSPNRIVFGGRKNAMKNMNISKNNIKHYEATRNDLNDKTTRLSAYIKFGCISIREMNEYIQKSKINEDARESLHRQLIWRDFYAQILDNFPEVLKGSMKSSLKNIKWENDKNKKFIEAWKTGQTGFPIIDAGMRELLQTGYMHNRARLIVGSFLPKTLLVNWQIGEKHFAQWLTDYDPASNNGNWQWVAGTGTDSQPYFRILNPYLQSKKYDTNAEYIKKWIPELKDVSSKDIHNWNDNISKKYPKIKYPLPIVDYDKQKQKALDMYANAFK